MNVTSQNLTTGEMIFTLTNLIAGTKYYIRAAGFTDAPWNYYNYSTTINTQQNPRVIMPVHIGGSPEDLDKIPELFRLIKSLMYTIQFHRIDRKMDNSR